MTSWDVLFYLNVKHRGDRSVGHTIMFTLAMALTLGLLLSIEGVGFDVIETINAAYPFDWSDSVRSPFNRKSGAAVLFTMPLALVFCVLYFGSGRAARAFNEYENLWPAPPRWIAPVASIVLSVGLYLCTILPSKESWVFVFPVQLGILVAVELFAIHMVRRRARI